MKEAADKQGLDLSTYIEKIRTVSDPIAAALLRLFDSLTEFNEEEAHNDAKQVANEHFKQKFAERFLIYPLLATASLVLVFAIDYSLCWRLSNQSYGLSIDLLGAIILGRGLLMGGVAIGAVGTSKLGYNPLLVKSMAKDSVDGVWGVAYILIGLTLQIIAVGNLGLTPPPWLIPAC